MTELTWPRWRLARLDPGMVQAILSYQQRHGSPLPPDFLEWADEAERVLLAARRRQVYRQRRVGVA